MGKKSIEKKVRLTNDNEKVQDLDLSISHASRLLRMPNNGGWRLPDNSTYELKADGLVKRSDTGTPKKTSKQRVD